MSAEGKPPPARSVRLFISSTFRDMQAERDILARRTFPALRARLRLRGVELLDVDLRWGITEEQSERGQTLAVCLEEIDRCRPFFIGVLGERYGWVPPEASLTPELKQAFPVLSSAAGRSATEIEILHGVLGDPTQARALFFERDPAWIETLPRGSRADFVEDGEARAKLNDLKAAIRKTGANLERYARPEELGDKLQAALERILDEVFPEQQAPDAFTLAGRMHVAFARERRGLYVGGEPYLAKLDAWAARDGAQPLLVTGASGSGKSALLANWLARRDGRLVFEHYLGASPESAEPMQLLRRLWEQLRRIADEQIPAPGDEQALLATLPERLQQAAARAARDRQTLIIALDGLDRLASGADLRWLPEALPQNVRLLLSAIAAPAQAASRGWATLEVKPLSDAQRRDFVARALQRMRKGLSDDRIARIVGHPLASAPLFLKTLLQELRVAGVHEQLDGRIQYYLTSRTLPELFSRFLERLERDCGADLTRLACSLIWASRAGLEEAEIIAIAKTTPSAWLALRTALADAVRDQEGRLAFDHDFIRQACAERYLREPGVERRLRLLLAEHMETLPPSPRQAEELAFQYLETQEWGRLELLLTDLSRFDFLHARGDVELLRYWLALRGQGRDIEQLIARAAAVQLPNAEQWRRENIYRVGRICDFLEFAGARGEELIRLRQQLILALTRTAGPDFYDTLRAEASFAQLMFKRGDYREAARLLERVVEAQKRTRGADASDMLVTMAHLGDALLSLGDYTAAKKALEDAFAGLTRVHGDDHPYTLGAALSLGEGCRAVGDSRRTKELQQHVVETRKRTLGAEHPDTLLAMHNLASTLADGGDGAAAIAMLQRVVSEKTRALGATNPGTLASMHNLASMMRDRGDLAGARDLLHHVAQGHVHALGSAHPHTVQVRTTLSDTLILLGDLKGARLAAEQNLRDLATCMDPEHPATLSAIASLCEVLRNTGDFADARNRMGRVVDLSLKHLGPEHADTLSHKNALGLLMIDCGDAAGGLRILKQAVEARERQLGPDHASTLSAWSSVAAARAALGDFEGACAIEQRSLDAAIRKLGREHRETLARMNKLAIRLEKLGDNQGARQILEEVLDTRTRRLGPNHPETLGAANNLGTALSNAGDEAGAQKVYERAVEGLARALGEAHPDTLSSMNNLATVLFNLGDLAAAKRLTERVLAGRTRVLGPSHPDTNLTRKNLEVIENRLRRL